MHHHDLKRPALIWGKQSSNAISILDSTVFLQHILPYKQVKITPPRWLTPYSSKEYYVFNYI